MPEALPQWEEGSPYATVLPALQHALADMQFKTPTPVQAQCLDPLLEGRDLLASAQTGTGKTAAFVLPLMHRLAANMGKWTPKSARALIFGSHARIGDSNSENHRGSGCLS